MISLCQVWWVSLVIPIAEVFLPITTGTVSVEMQPAFCMFYALLKKGHEMQVHGWKVENQHCLHHTIPSPYTGDWSHLGMCSGWVLGMGLRSRKISAHALHLLILLGLRGGNTLGSKHVAIQSCRFPKDLRLSKMETQVFLPSSSLAMCMITTYNNMSCEYSLPTHLSPEFKALVTWQMSLHPFSWPQDQSSLTPDKIGTNYMGVAWWARKVHSIIHVSLKTFSPLQWFRKTEEGELITHTAFYLKDLMPTVPTKQQKQVLTVLGNQGNLRSR